jgi:Type I phosphodiesterase / nucleotide pyrophosphatase
MRRWWLAGILAASVAVAAITVTSGAAQNATLEPSGGCALANGIQHVIYLQFDNTHYRRDVPDIPSDLEQMPHLLDFMTQNGTLLTDDHTILISHTSAGILSSLTGLYPDRNGATVANSYGYYKPDGTPGFSSVFKYWTQPVDPVNDPLPNMIGTEWQSRTTPPPWLTFTQAGCDVGGVWAPNIELESASAADTGELARIFGAGSPEQNEAKTSPAQAFADFVGLAIHCAAGSPFCDSPDARHDGVTPYDALFGAKYVNPAITGGDPCVNDTTGQPIKDPTGTWCGFPGFDGDFARNTLGQVFQMQKAGIPITFGYITEAHDSHVDGHSFGPGEADYKQQLAEYDSAFATFFQQLGSIGIDRTNTLFVITVDEGDHFAGGPGTPQSDGSLAYDRNQCTDLSACPSDQIGMVTANVRSFASPATPAFDIHADTAPTFYVHGNPTRTDPAVRSVERDLLAARVHDPYVGADVPVAIAMADPVTEQTLHMVNADPRRTPTFTLFGNDDLFLTTSDPCAGVAVCVVPKFAWTHGGIQEVVGNTWAGLVGPGVKTLGATGSVWTDHTDMRPTILQLLGLSDSYQDDGRVITEALDPAVIAPGLDTQTAVDLGTVYKQLNAPFGAFAQDLLTASTAALATGSENDDGVYTSVEQQIASLTSRRDWLAAAMRAALDRAAFQGAMLDEQQTRYWIEEGRSLLEAAGFLARLNFVPPGNTTNIPPP